MLRLVVKSNWNVMAHGDAREEKWKVNKRMEWVTSKRHMTAEQRLARVIQTLQADVHNSPASSRLNWRPRRFKWTRPFRRKTKSGFCSCAITFQTQFTYKKIPVGFKRLIAPNSCGFLTSCSVRCWWLPTYIGRCCLHLQVQMSTQIFFIGGMTLRL
jgi:hypothetical protein